MLFSGIPKSYPTNIRQGWKGLPGTKTPAFYENPEITVVKSSMSLTPGLNEIRILLA